jgi:hypothetical protein
MVANYKKVIEEGNLLWLNNEILLKIVILFLEFIKLITFSYRNDRILGQIRCSKSQHVEKRE